MRISDWSSDVCSSDLISKTKDESDVTVETRVLATIAELQKDYPDVRFTKVISTVDTTRRSFTSTQHVLIEGIFLAIFVVWLFLRNWRATAIAAVAMPLSLIPTFAVMAAFRFSLNGITARKSVVEGQSVSVRVNLCGRRVLK